MGDPVRGGGVRGVREGGREAVRRVREGGVLREGVSGEGVEGA